MTRGKTLEARLELTRIDDLFTTPDIDPFDPRYADHSGKPALAFIADEVYANGSYQAASVTFVVPDAGHDVDDVRAAVRRWASARERVHLQDVAAMRWRGLRSLLSGLVLFATLIAVSQLVGGDRDGLTDTLAKGLEVAAWVVLWFPIDTLVWSLWQYRLDRRCYAVVRDMDIRLEIAAHP